MPTRLKFPQGSAFQAQLQFVENGAPVDLTGATLTATVGETTVSTTVTNTALGLFRLSIPASATADKPRTVEYFWRVAALLADGRTLISEGTHGWLQLTPAALLAPEAPCDTTVLGSTATATSLTSANFVGIRVDITTAAQHRAVVTAGRTPLPWVIATLENDTLTTWSLRTRVSGETDDGTLYRVPDDYHATSNNVIWVRASLT